MTATDVPPGVQHQLACAGGSEAIAAAYREHAGAVFTLAHRLLRDRSLAEEVTQEVFVRLCTRPERFDPRRGSLRSFLLADCHGRSIDAIRSESARREREVREVRLGGARRTGDIAGEVCQTDVHEQLAELVHGLPVRERDAIVLAYADGITYREVAAALGEPEGTVKGRIRSGLQRLRAQAHELDLAPA